MSTPVVMYMYTGCFCDPRLFWGASLGRGSDRGLQAQKCFPTSTNTFFSPGENVGAASLLAPPARQRLHRRLRGHDQPRDKGAAGDEELLPSQALPLLAHLAPDRGGVHLVELLDHVAHVLPPGPAHLLQRVRRPARGGQELLQSKSSMPACSCSKVENSASFGEMPLFSTLFHLLSQVLLSSIYDPIETKNIAR